MGPGVSCYLRPCGLVQNRHATRPRSPWGRCCRGSVAGRERCGPPAQSGARSYPRLWRRRRRSMCTARAAGPLRRPVRPSIIGNQLPFAAAVFHLRVRSPPCTAPADRQSSGTARSLTTRTTSATRCSLVAVPAQHGAWGSAFCGLLPCMGASTSRLVERGSIRFARPARGRQRRQLPPTRACLPEESAVDAGVAEGRVERRDQAD